MDELECDYCGTKLADPWHHSGHLKGVENRHIHACDKCHTRGVDHDKLAVAALQREVNSLKLRLDGAAILLREVDGTGQVVVELKTWWNRRAELLMEIKYPPTAVEPVSNCGEVCKECLP